MARYLQFIHYGRIVKSVFMIPEHFKRFELKGGIVTQSHTHSTNSKKCWSHDLCQFDKLKAYGPSPDHHLFLLIIALEHSHTPLCSVCGCFPTRMTPFRKFAECWCMWTVLATHIWAVFSLLVQTKWLCWQPYDMCYKIAWECQHFTFN